MGLFISPVRKVVVTCRIVFWNQSVELHLTPRSKGQRSNLKNDAYLWEKTGNKIKVGIFVICDTPR